MSRKWISLAVILAVALGIFAAAARSWKRSKIHPSTEDAFVGGDVYAVSSRIPGTLLTVCCLTLQNGFNVVGESASVSVNNFDAEIGRKVSRAKARDKIWALEGYLLKQYLSTLPAHFSEPKPT